MTSKEEDTLTKEMNKLKVESTQDSGTDQQEGEESGGSEKKETEKTSQEKDIKVESTTDSQPPSDDSAATAEDSKQGETK